MTRSIVTAAILSLVLAGTAMAQPARGPAAGLPSALANLASDAAGVLGSGAEARLLLDETDHGVAASRTVGVGEEYREGWKVTALSAGSVTLLKAGESRTIALAGRRQAAASTATSVPTAAVATSNALVGGSGLGGAARTPALQAAITAGNTKQVLQLGGSAQAVAEALVAQGRLQNAQGLDLSSAQFVQIGDSYGLAVASPDGSRRQMVTSPDFDGFKPTGPVVQFAGGPPPPPPAPPPPPVR